MPIDYKKYPSNWKSEIRPAILERSDNKCEFCNVKNYEYIFRGYIPTEKGVIEVYQDAEGNVYNAKNSNWLFLNFNADIFPLSGNINQRAIKVILTIAHLDHNIENNDYNNLKALCQRCHNRHDKNYRKSNRNKNKLTLF